MKVQDVELVSRRIINDKTLELKFNLHMIWGWIQVHIIKSVMENLMECKKELNRIINSESIFDIVKEDLEDKKNRDERDEGYIEWLNSRN